MTVDEVLKEVKKIKKDYRRYKHLDSALDAPAGDIYNQDKIKLFTKVLQAVEKGEENTADLAKAALTLS